jgi:hypothetical protein
MKLNDIFISYFLVFISFCFFGMLDSNCPFGVKDVHVEDNDVYLAFANSSVPSHIRKLVNVVDPLFFVHVGINKFFSLCLF